MAIASIAQIEGHLGRVRWRTVERTACAYPIPLATSCDDGCSRNAIAGHSRNSAFSYLRRSLLRDSRGARSREIRAPANYKQALANLAAAEGSTLERDHLNIEAK